LAVVRTKQFQIVKSQVKIANKQLSDFHKNDLTVEGNVVSNKFSIDVKDNTIFYRASAIEGKDDIKVYWWGCKIWLSKTTVRKILNVGSAGGSAALGAKIGAVPGAVVGSVLSEFVTPSAARAIWIRHNWVIISGFGFQ
jgi:hypothetical protein